MTDDGCLRQRVREAMQAGALPNRLPDELFGGIATGVQCAVCGESIDDGMEMELVFNDDSRVDPKCYYTHPGCLSVFEREIHDVAEPPVPRAGFVASAY